MKKTMKRIALILVSVMTICLLGGCGSTFDASAYVKALLDNSYKNDSTGFVEMKLGTAEDATTLYEQGLDTEMDAMLAQTELNDEQAAEYRKVFSDIYSNVKYTVGEAELQEDGSYIVNVTCEQMNIFGPSMEAYMTKVTEMVTAWTEASMNGEEVASEEEMLAEVTMALKVCMEDALANITYNEPTTVTVKISIVDNMWTPDQTDLANIAKALFDVDAMTNMIPQ